MLVPFGGLISLVTINLPELRASLKLCAMFLLLVHKILVIRGLGIT
jgi:hypothetical protein